ncbi:MAG: four helix bundle protein [Planctomycetia bacterium]|nr:four helix bundle protein [Planctomycetia bacterium]
MQNGGDVESNKKRDLAERTKQFAIRVIRLYSSLPKNDGAAQILGKQILRSGTSVGAQYREAMRARSTVEFISKIQSSLQELEETRYWLELLIEAELVPIKRLAPLLEESMELIAILVASTKTAKRRSKE